MDSTNEFLNRANQRMKLMDDLDSSFLEPASSIDEENSSSSAAAASTFSPNVLKPKHPEPRSPVKLNNTNNSAESSAVDAVENVSPLKAKFAKLSEGYQAYEVDIKPAKSKEDYITGPTRRISMDPKPKEDAASPVTKKPVYPDVPSIKENPNVEADLPAIPKEDAIAKPSKQVQFDVPVSSHTFAPVKRPSMGGEMNFGKARSIFESAFTPAVKYQSPYAAKRAQAVTNIRRYDDPNPTKKPAQCEIVSGPTFNQSVNYWKDRERKFPSNDFMDVATQIFKGPTKRENTKEDSSSSVFYASNNQSPRSEATSPSPKISKFIDAFQPSAMEQAKKLVSFDEESFDYGNKSGNSSMHTATDLNSSSNAKYFGVKPMVVTESFTACSTVLSSRAATSSSATSISVPSDSFDFQKSPHFPNDSSSLSPLGPSLLDDINQDFTKVHTPRSQKIADSVFDDDSSKPTLAYSLSNYRKTESTPQREKIFAQAVDVKEIMSPTVNGGDEMIRKLPRDQVEKKLKQLETAQTVIANQIQQTEKGLRVARHTSNKITYPNYEHEVDLLQKLATLIERRRICYQEFNRLRDASDIYYIFPRATLKFTRINVEIDRNLDIAPNHHAYLFALLKYRDEAMSTRAIFINPMIKDGTGSVEFNDVIEIEDVAQDFSMSIEIHGLTLVRKEPKNDHRFNIRRMVSSPQPEKTYSNETFGRIGLIVIEREDLIAGNVLTLSEYQKPLAGRCRINVSPKVTDIDDNKWSGFLSVYRVVDGKGAWELNYSNIKNNRLNFWRYPEDADDKEPILSLNMRDMTELASPSCDEKLGFQYDFDIKILDQSEKIHAIMLSTAEERERDRVINAINRSYQYLNTWRLS